MKKSADVVVIGGGIIGTAVAYYLAKKKMDVVLVERHDLSSGCTGAGGSLIGVAPVPTGPPDPDLILMSWDLYQRLPEELDFDFELHKLGRTVLIRSENTLSMAREMIAKQRETKQGLALQNENRVLEIEPFTLLDTADLKEREPFLRTDGLVGGFFVSQTASVNPFLVPQAFVNATKRLGGSAYLHTEVKDIRLKNQRIESVVTDRGEIKAKFVVDAAGVWSPFVGRMIGMEIPVFPRKGQALVTETTTNIATTVLTEGDVLSPGDQSRMVSIHTLLGKEWTVHCGLHQTRHGNCFIAASSENKGYDLTSEPEVIREIARKGVEFLPVLKDVRILRAFAGLRPQTPDGNPILGKVEGVEGFVLATGAGSVGMAAGAAIGKLISEVITGAKTDMPIDRFNLSRFQKLSNN